MPHNAWIESTTWDQGFHINTLGSKPPGRCQVTELMILHIPLWVKGCISAECPNFKIAFLNYDLFAAVTLSTRKISNHIGLLVIRTWHLNYNEKTSLTVTQPQQDLAYLHFYWLAKIQLTWDCLEFFYRQPFQAFFTTLALKCTRF